MKKQILGDGKGHAGLMPAIFVTIIAVAIFASIAFLVVTGACFGLTFALVIAARGMAAGWRTVVGGVKPRAFENDSHWLVNLAQGFLLSFRAAGQGGIAKLLLAVELYTATFATIRVNWHTTPQLCWFSGNAP